MGRNKKHQTEIRAEKSKIKLKTKLTKTKFLPKGGNVTDVNFKIKPIVIREQLKYGTSNELLTRKKQNLKDLLTRLNHFNTTMRYEACEGLIELMNFSPVDSIEQSLYRILESVCKLILDIEAKVRQKSIKVLHVILSKVSPTKVAPFFNILTSYVSCAMTHIDKRIQEDSLLVIDVYLDHIPDLVTKDFDKLFSNFLTLISKLRSDSKFSRTLTVNLGSKLTSIKWRIKVLSRLQRIFNVVIQKRNVNTKVIDCPVVNCENVFHIPLYRKIRSGYDSIPTLDQNIEMDYLKVLVPLLYETWAEAVPIDELNYRENGAMFIDQDAASILSCVVGILYALLNFAKYSSSLNENHVHKLLLSKENKLLNHLLNQFPFRQHEYRKKIEKELSKLLTINTEPKCVQENLLICYVFASLYKTFPNKQYLQKAHGIVEYVNVCLSNRNYIPANSIKTITLLLRIIFFDNFSSWQKNQVISEKLLDNIVNCHNNLSIESEQGVDVFNLLVDISKEPDIPGSPRFFKWLSNLPLLLLKPEVSIRYVDSLSLLARQNNKIFLNALLQNLDMFLENLPKLKIINDGLPLGQIKLIGMLHYLPKLDGKNIESIQSFIKNNQDWIFVKNMEFMLSLRR